MATIKPFAVAALAIAALTGGAAAAGYCPANHRLWGAICIDPESGDVAEPQSAAAAYARYGAATGAALLCSGWRLRVVAAINDASAVETTPRWTLANAEVLLQLADALCAENRQAEALRVFDAALQSLR